MIVWGFVVVATLVVTQCLASASELEEFFTSKKVNEAVEQIAEESGVTEDELTQFMRRSGLLLHQRQPKTSSSAAEEDQLSDLQNQLLNMQKLRQQQQLEQEQLKQHQDQQQRQLRLLQQQLKYYPQQSQPDDQYEAQPQQLQPTKADRQGGYYGDEGHLGYDGHAGYSNAAHHRVPEQVGLHLPIPQVGIKLDPFGLLKLLLQLLPRPLLNLNGKIFLGVELGKGVSLGKGAGPPGHHGGGGKIISIPLGK